MPDKLLRPDIVAKRLNISRATVYRLIQREDLAFLRTSPRNIRIYESSVDEYLKRLNPDFNTVKPKRK